MDKNSKKVLKLINHLSKNSSADIDIIRNKCKIPADDFFEIMSYLSNDELIKFPDNGYVETTNKGKTYIHTSRMRWLSDNIVSILALIVSTLAFIEATIALILK